MPAKESYASLEDPRADGVAHIQCFIADDLLRDAQAELHDPARIGWRDNHSTYTNRRGLEIVQNHDVFALRLAADKEDVLSRLPALASAAQEVQGFVRGLGAIFPELVKWQPTELSLHRYDDVEVGLSFHKDNLRFVGAIAILCLEGSCDLAIRRDEEATTAYATNPGDLVLLRAPGLIETPGLDTRPEHAVLNLQTPTRTSMMLRENDKPNELLPGFIFDN